MAINITDVQRMDIINVLDELPSKQPITKNGKEVAAASYHHLHPNEKFYLDHVIDRLCEIFDE